MRMIDAMAYRKVLDEEMDNLLENTKNSIKYRLGIEVAIADLGDMPTIDAVPVVRCRDCCASGEDGWVCCGSGMMPEHGTFPHLFCSEGKRKDGA